MTRRSEAPRSRPLEGGTIDGTGWAVRGRPVRSGVLTPDLTIISIDVMTKTRRVTANLPDQLLEEAMAVTGKGITETLVEGLRLVRRARAYEKAMALRGKVKLAIDLDVSRERRRR